MKLSIMEEPSLRKIKEAPFEAKNKDMSIDLATISQVNSEIDHLKVEKVNERRMKRKLSKPSKTMAELPDVTRKFSSIGA